MKLKATAQIVRNYQELFVNRRAYTMQSLRPHPETGRHYYFRPSQKGTDVPLMLTDSTVRQHLEGAITIGLYAIIADEPKETGTIEEPLDLAFIVAGLLIAPIEQVLAAGVPRHAVEKVEQLSDLEHLRSSKHLRRFTVVSPNLVNPECQPVLLRRVLQFGERNRVPWASPIFSAAYEFI